MSIWELKKLKNYNGVQGPLLLVIMDGVGIYKNSSDGYFGNAFDLANTPTLDSLLYWEKINTTLKAHGTAVGLPSDEDMGNSEVGHNAIGAGRVFEQGAKLVNKAIEDKSIFNSKTWLEYIGDESHPGHILVLQDEKNDNSPAVHFIGLLSDGNVHSHIEHLLALLEKCFNVGVERVFVHILLDGRDVEERSAEKYIQQLENQLDKYRQQGRDYWIASGGGRMVITMDRYQANWSWVELGWKTHVLGEGRMFGTAIEAIKQYRKEHSGIIDQDLPPFVIKNSQEKPRGTINDDDVVIFFNFRGDRAIEISRAFTEENFNKFDRKRVPKVLYAGMMEYDGDLHIPNRYLVEPPAIEKTISEYLVHQNIMQYAISETQKFGHVTYFWNGNNSEKFDEKLEDWVEITSDRLPFEEVPQMKANQIAKSLIDAILSSKYKFLRVNFANGDMVGHTGNLQAAVMAMEAVDRNIGLLLKVIDRVGGTIVITADHGNCDQMFEVDKKSGKVKLKQNGKQMAKTSHTLNPVPFIVHGPDTPIYSLNENIKKPGLANIAATLMNLLGFEAPVDYLPSIIDI